MIIDFGLAELDPNYLTKIQTNLPPDHPNALHAK